MEENTERKIIAVIMGGFTSERHVSLESGRNIYNKLFASTKYDPIPIFLSGTISAYRLFTLPLHLLLKDNADDIHNALLHPAKFKESHALLDPIKQEAEVITHAYAKNIIFQPEELTYQALKERADFVFLALHGKPGEDGTLQKLLEQYQLPYNGSGVDIAALTMNKYATNHFLTKRGFQTPKQLVITKENWTHHPLACLHSIEDSIAYPMIAKPVDDGCSTGVIKIINKEMLIAYAAASFRVQEWIPSHLIKILAIPSADFIPRQTYFLIETFIEKNQKAVHCLEITAGLLTHIGEKQQTLYEIFEPSEVLATETILSLEEKFLTGEGHNITPARFHPDNKISLAISQRIKIQLAKIAQSLNLQGYARIDAFAKIHSLEKVEVWVIEINMLPAMTPATCIFHQCAISGYTPFDFIDAIIQYGFTKRNFGSTLSLT